MLVDLALDSGTGTCMLKIVFETTSCTYKMVVQTLDVAMRSLILGYHCFLFAVFFGEALYFHSLLSTPYTYDQLR